MIQYLFEKEINKEALFSLYSSVGWTAYTKNMAQLQRGIAQSWLVITAWQNEELIALARVVGDGETIAYVQDILVKPEWQRKGVGKALMEAVFYRVKHIRQVVLMTDADESNRDAINWYTKLGFRRFEDYAAQGFARLNNVNLDDSPS